MRPALAPRPRRHFMQAPLSRRPEAEIVALHAEIDRRLVHVMTRLARQVALMRGVRVGFVLRSPRRDCRISAVAVSADGGRDRHARRFFAVATGTEGTGRLVPFDKGFAPISRGDKDDGDRNETSSEDARR